MLEDPDRKSRLKERLKGLRYPVVSKPLDKYGSRGIYISENLDELIEASQKTAEFSDMPEILVEEYNDGYEFNMMTWVLDGQVRKTERFPCSSSGNPGKESRSVRLRHVFSDMSMNLLT